MHDIDRTTMEAGSEIDMFEGESFGYEFTEEGEFTGDTETTSPFSEAEEMEMAANLLEVTDEAELDQFLGNLIKKAGRAVGRFIKSPTGRALGGILKGAVKKALPVVGGALGTAIGGPAGGLIGGKLASTAGRIFGLELEGLSPEDQEYEVARRLVRFAGAATQKAALTPPTVAPQAAAKSAVIAAAKQYAPGLLRGGMSGGALGGTSQSGHWVRKGNKIILLGI